MWYMYDGFGWWMIFGGVWMFVFWGGLIALIIWGISKLTRGSSSIQKNEPLEVVKRFFVLYKALFVPYVYLLATPAATFTLTGTHIPLSEHF